ncbi:MAG: RidA family protein [Blastocatellia bacterium]|nr:RidA family protein [Blastocatellia bacterium]
MNKLFNIVILFTLFALGAFQISAQSKRAVESADAPKAIGPYSQAILANGFVFTAGQIGSDPKTGTLVEGGIVEQTEQALKNLSAVLKASNSSFDNAVKVTVFLADMNDFAKMNEVFAKFFKAPFPARSTVQVARLPRDAKVEIELIAVVGNAGSLPAPRP